MVFCSYFVSPEGVNYTLFFIFFSFNILFFFSFSLVRHHIFLIALFCFFFSAISYCGLIIPLNPLILTYDLNYALLPRSDWPVVNLFFLFFIPSVLFSRGGWRRCCFAFFPYVAILCWGNTGHIIERNSRNDMKIAVIQTGLYYEKGGSTSSFYDDISDFLKYNPDVDLVVFSENKLYGYKNAYNRRLLDNLMSDITHDSLNKKHAFLFNFHGYRNINNVVSMYSYNDDELINQKTVLIPFIEKKRLFDVYEPLFSDFLWKDKNIRRKLINFDGIRIDTYICYDALFPVFHSERNNITITQSNYRLLDNGWGNDRLKKNGSILGWFSTGINSSAYINVQDSGGTVIIRENGQIDEKAFSLSKEAPFFIADLRF